MQQAPLMLLLPLLPLPLLLCMLLLSTPLWWHAPISSVKLFAIPGSAGALAVAGWLLEAPMTIGVSCVQTAVRVCDGCARARAFTPPHRARVQQLAAGKQQSLHTALCIEFMQAAAARPRAATWQHFCARYSLLPKHCPRPSPHACTLYK